MIIQPLIDAFERDLAKLSEEIKQYEEGKMWKVAPGITNSGGNLCLHILGNLNYFIGSVLGQTGYIRNRDLEFSAKNISKEELLKSIQNTKDMVVSSLGRVDDSGLGKDFPVQLGGRTFSTISMIVILATHLSYHLGQINYHRRLLS